MSIIKKNKKGVSLAELLASIAIIGIASTTITSMVITSYKGQIRAQQYVLANEIAKTYDSMLAKDITKENVNAIPTTTWTNDFVEINEDLLKKLGKTDDTSHPYGQTYECLYTTHFQLNNMTFDSSNVRLRIYMISPSFAYFKTEIIVSYQGNRQVTYSGTHFKE